MKRNKRSPKKTTEDPPKENNPVLKIKRTNSPKGKVKPPKERKNKDQKRNKKVKTRKYPKTNPVGRPKTKQSILLSEKEQCFADLILENMHRSKKVKLPQYQCYMKAYPEVTEKSARVLASKLVKVQKIQDYIQARKKAAADRVELNVDMVLRGLLRIAMFDPRKLYKENGHMKKIPDLDDDTALGIHGIKFSNMYIGKGKNKRIKSVLDSVQTESRKAAWDLLGTHLSMWDGNTSTSPEEFVDDVRTFASTLKEAVPGGEI